MQRIALWTAFGLMVAAGSYAGCTSNFDQFTSGSGTGGSSSMASTGANMGGSGGGDQCVRDNQCKQPTNICQTVHCDKHLCVTASQPDTTPCPLGGDKGNGKCDGNGKCVECNQPQDCDAPACQQPTCTNHTCGTKNVGSDPNCKLPLSCQGGNCVGCTSPDQCPDPGDCKVKNCTPSKMCSPTKAPAGTGCSGGDVCDSSDNCVQCTTGFAGNCTGSQVCFNELCCNPLGKAAACGMQCMNSADDMCGGMVGCDSSVCTGLTECDPTAGTCCSTPPIGMVCGNQCANDKTDSCNVMRDCAGNMCTSPDTCGGGGTPGQCGCTPLGKMAACGMKCTGMANDGCGGMVNCDVSVCGAGGHCVDNVCCSTANCPTCQTCNGTMPGTCTAIAQNSQDLGVCDDTNGMCPNSPDKCACDGTTNGSSACKDKLGQGCMMSSECANGNCNGMNKCGP